MPKIFPMNFGDAHRGAQGQDTPGSGVTATWPVTLSTLVEGTSVSSFLDTYEIIHSHHSSGWNDPPNFYAPPGSSSHTISPSAYYHRVTCLVFDVSELDGIPSNASLTLDFDEGGFAWIEAYQDSSVGQAPAHANTVSFSGEWVGGTFADLDDLDAFVMSRNTVPVDGTAFSEYNFLHWFDPLYNDISSGSQTFLGGVHSIELSNLDFIEGKDWVGILIAIDQQPHWFYSSWETGTPDGTFYQTYNSGMFMGINPVFGIYLDVDVDAISEWHITFEIGYDIFSDLTPPIMVEEGWLIEIEVEEVLLEEDRDLPLSGWAEFNLIGGALQVSGRIDNLQRKPIIAHRPERNRITRRRY